MIVKVKRLHPDAKIPTRGTPGAAGLDLYALEAGFAYDGGGSCVLRTGIAVEVLYGYELQVRSRSGFAFKHHVTAYHGTIDSDYRGEILVKLTNNSDRLFVVQAGERIAQAVIAPVWMGELTEVNELTDTPRGENGFGSTGTT